MIVDFFFFKQKTAYEMRISDWSSDVCSSDLDSAPVARTIDGLIAAAAAMPSSAARRLTSARSSMERETPVIRRPLSWHKDWDGRGRSEEHTSELQSLMRISYAVFCLKKKKTHNTKGINNAITTSKNMT